MAAGVLEFGAATATTTATTSATATSGATAGSAELTTAAWLLVQLDVQADASADARAAIGAALAALPGVRSCLPTSGAYDFIVQLGLGGPTPSSAISHLRSLPAVGHVVCCRPAAGESIVVVP